MRSALVPLLALGATTASAGASDPPPRQPTGKWTVDFGEAHCVATRAYGSADGPLHLVLKAPPIGGVMQVAVSRAGGRVPPEQVSATIGVEGRPPLRTNMLIFSPEGMKSRVYMLNMPLAEFTPVRRSRQLSIRSRGLDQAFALANMEPLLKVMDECVADLRKLWNVTDDKAEQSVLPKRAAASITSYFDNGDYPAQAIMAGATGVVSFALLVNEAGRVADCTVVATSGVAALDGQTCAILRNKAKFEPAIGADGKPAKDAVVGRIKWVMPS